jgi:2-desacetyl-2-hydroxyethyl bacteriochlorophyllide A dehydrogenase
MKAIVLKGPNDFSLQEIEDPIPASDQVEIRVRMAGICGTDVHLLRGRNPFAHYPIVPGHEYMGEVLTSPKASKVKRGERVTVYPATGCGKCEACKAGYLPHCPEFRFIGVQLPGGCFAERVVVDCRRIFPLPEDMDDEIGAMVEPTAVGVHANRRADIRGGERVVVIGGGTIGILIAQVALASGASHVILSEPIAQRRAVAREMGLELVCNPLEEDLVSFTRRNTGMADVVFDAVGTEKTLIDSEEILRPDGRLVLIALPHTEGQGVPYRRIFAKELTVIGSRTYFMEDFPEAIELLHTQRVNPRRLISRVIPLHRFSEGIDLLERKPEENIKIMVNPLMMAS